MAVADVILSPLCDEVGFDLYEIATELRSALLHRLKTDPRFGPARLQELADFLLTYHQQAQLHSDDPDVQELAQVQRWNALAQGQPTLVVRDLAQRLVGVPGQDGAEWGRMAAVMARLPLPEGEGQVLLHYAWGMARLTQGEMQPALQHFRQLPGPGGRGVQVAGVMLGVPEAVRQQLQPPVMTRRRWLQWVGWGTVGTVGAVLISRTIDSERVPSTDPDSLTIDPENMPPAPSGKTLQTQAFEVVTVDRTGAINSRRTVQAQSFAEDLGDGVMLDLVAIPGGSFTMGAPLSEEGNRATERPLHPVTVLPFFLGKYVVTQAQYQAVMGTNPSRFTGNSADHPVEQVSWEDAIAFCQKLSEQTGHTYRLPSEAEWEYACRAGTTTPFHFGETITTDIANYDGEYSYGEGPVGIYRRETTEVGSFPPNAFGLYDMHGTVLEWCEDVWHDNYDNAPDDGTAWTEGGEQHRRVVRGGSWISHPRDCRSAYRLYAAPGDRYINTGFRVVCVVRGLS